MAEDLTGNEAGVGEQVVALAGAAGSDPTATPASPAKAEVVDLSKLPEFKAYQASTDRRFEVLRGELVQAQAQVTEAQRRQQEAQLADATPEDRAAYYQQQVADMQVQHAATELLKAHGLDKDAPGLVWTERTWEGYAALAASVAEIERVRATELVKSQDGRVASAADAAKQAALKSAGVTTVNKSVGTATAPDLMAAFNLEKARLVGSGNVGAYTALKTKYREAGLEI